MQNLLPGESVANLPNGNVVLTMRNGTTKEFTPDEWADFNDDFMSNLSTGDMVLMLMDSIRLRDIVPTSEMIDALLDIHKRALEQERGAHEMSRLWSRANRKVDYLSELLTEAGAMPESADPPEDWVPKWMFEDAES